MDKTQTLPSENKTTAATVAANAKAESAAFLAAILSLLTDGSKVQAIALDNLAVALGESTNKAGRPMESAYFAFVFAITRQTLSYKRRADLMQKIIAATPNGHKPAAVLKASANHEKGSASYRLNAPASVSIAVE